MRNELLELLRRAINLDDQGDLDAAILLLGGGLESDGWSAESPEVPALTHHLVWLCERAGKAELGITYATKCLASFPRDLGSLYKLARLLASCGQRDEAQAVAEAFRLACESSDDPQRGSWAELVGPLEKDLAENRPT